MRYVDTVPFHGVRFKYLFSIVPSVLLLAPFAALPASGAASLTENKWQPVDGVYDGSVTNEAHWSLGHVPKTLEKMLIGRQDCDYTLTFPEGSYTNRANFDLNVGDGRMATVDGSRTLWVMPGAEDGESEIHSGIPFYVKSAGRPIFPLDISYSLLYSHPVAEISNFNFTVKGSANRPEAVFNGGSYDFRDPVGAEWASPTNPVLLLCRGDGSAETYNLAFHDVSMRAWNVGIQAAGSKGGNVLFDGGDYYFEKLQFPDGLAAYASNISGESVTVFTNGAVLSAAYAKVGHRANKIVRLDIVGGGTRFETRSDKFAASDGAGISYVKVADGAVLHMSAGANFLYGKGTNCTCVTDATVSSGADVFVGTVHASNVTASKAVFAATNATVSTAGKFIVNNVGQVEIAGAESKWNLGALWIGDDTLSVAGKPKVVVSDGSVTATNDSNVAAFGSAEMTIDGGTVIFGRYLRIGANSNSSGTLTVNGGVLNNDFAKAESIVPESTAEATVAYLGASSSTAKGVLNVCGGEARFYSLYAAWSGAGEINVSGGRLSCRSDLRLANNSTAAGGVLTQTGGEIYVPRDLKNIGANAAGNARIVLNGGRFICKSITAGNAAKLNGGTGSVALSADGGTLVAYADATAFIQKFDSAVLSGDGLTIDTAGYDITVGQNFSGTGPLSLAGGGKVSFASGTKLSCPLAVTGGTTVVFGDLSLSSLTLSDADGLMVPEIDAASTISVKGDFAIAGPLTIEFSSAPSIGTVADVFSVTGSVSEETVARWTELRVANALSGAAYDASVVEADDAKVFRVTFREPIEKSIAVADGESQTHSTNIFMSVNDTLDVFVGEGADARFEGVLSRGRLIKDGPGTLTLANADNELYNGVVFRLGTLNLDYPQPGGVADWCLGMDAESAYTNLTLTSTGDVAISDFASGTGMLTTASSGKIRIDVPAGSERVVQGYLCVAEGEVEFRGPLNGVVPKVKFVRQKGSDDEHALTVGLPDAGGTRSRKAGIIVNGVQLTAANTMIAGKILEGDPVQETYIVVTNNGVLNATGLFFSGKQENNPDINAAIYLDSGTLVGTWTYNYYGKPATPAKIVARNGSRTSGTCNFRGKCDMFYDASVMTGADEEAAHINYFSNWDYAINLTFVNGSIAKIGAIKSGWEGGKYPNPARVNLTFDDSEFKGMSGGDFGHKDPGLSANPFVNVFALGAGPVLNVPSGSVYTWSYPLLDADDEGGGFIKRGAGTLKVGMIRKPDMTTGETFAFSHTGPTRVEAGTLDLDGNTWLRGNFGAGEGVVANGTVRNARISLEVENGAAKGVPNFAADCAFTGRTTVDLLGAGLPVGSILDVAQYAGNAPDVSAWRLVGNGETSGRFTAADGKVSVEIVTKDYPLMLIVR